MLFLFDTMTSANLERVIQENKDQVIEGIKYRAPVSTHHTLPVETHSISNNEVK